MMIRVAFAASVAFLAGCEQVYPAEPYFAEFQHFQRDLTGGTLLFERSNAWKRNQGKFGFQVDGWTVSAVGLDCENNKVSESPLEYRIDTAAGTIEFGTQEKTRCLLRGAGSASFMIYPIISSRGLFDPGEIEGAEYFQVVFKPIIR